MPLWVIAVYALAVARVTRLVTDDRITQRPRIAIRAHLAEGSLADYLLSCRWCVSIWVSAAAAPAAWFAGRSPWLLVPALALAFSYVTGWLASREGR